jgi:hypothetical protein
MVSRVSVTRTASRTVYAQANTAVTLSVALLGVTVWRGASWLTSASRWSARGVPVTYGRAAFAFGDTPTARRADHSRHLVGVTG